MGNRIDVDEADLIGFFASDPNTKVITLYIEGVKDARKFQAAVKACRKPIVIFKAGRTAQGRKAAESHTRSLAGKDEVYDAVFRQFRIHRAESRGGAVRFLEGACLCAPARRAADAHRHQLRRIGDHRDRRCGGQWFPNRPLPDALASQLREVLPPHFIVGNPLDLTGDGNAELFRHVIDDRTRSLRRGMTIFGDPIPGRPGGPGAGQARCS